MPMIKNDLINLRDKVKERLDALIEGTPILINRRNAQNLYNPTTGGWCANIGRLSPARTGMRQNRLLIFLDDQYYNNKISYFIETRDKDLMYKFLKKIDYINLFGPHVRTIRYDDSRDDWKNDIEQINDVLAENEFDKTFLELSTNFANGRYYYGKCDSSNKITKKLVERIVTFYLDIAYAIAANPIINGGEMEGTISITKHIQRERNQKLSRERKQKDNYQCQICRIRFEKVYGKIGKNFAETHHIIPLAELETPRKTTIDDLVTVCANCHRMLHRLDGEEGDIERLQNEIQYCYEF